MVNNKTDIQTEQKIMKAALSVFSEHGYVGSTMQMIADKAKVNKALLHYYFRSKEQLYAVSFEKIFLQMFAQLNIALNEHDPIDKNIRKFIELYCQAINENKNLAVFMIRELSSGNQYFIDNAKKVFKGVMEKQQFAFIQIIQQAQARGEICKVNPIMLAFTIIGTILHFVLVKPIIYELSNIPEVAISEKYLLKLRKDSLYEIIWQGLKQR